MRRVPAMQVQVVRSSVIGLQDRQILLLEMTVELMASVQGEEERVVRIVGIEDEHLPEVEGVVARHGREISVEEVVLLFVELGILDAEGFVEVGARILDSRKVQVIDHDG